MLFGATHFPNSCVLLIESNIRQTKIRYSHHLIHAIPWHKKGSKTNSAANEWMEMIKEINYNEQLCSLLFYIAKLCCKSEAYFNV